MFTYCVDGVCHGLIIAHVDDFLFGGDKLFHVYIISKIRKMFVISLEESSDMKYLGLNVSENETGILLTMDQYVESINPVLVNDCSDKNASLSKPDYTSFRHVIGQINCCATQVRLNASFMNCQLSNSSSKPTLNDLLTANKVVRSLKSADVGIQFSCLEGDMLWLIAFTDASYANLPTGGS